MSRSGVTLYIVWTDEVVLEHATKPHGDFMHTKTGECPHLRIVTYKLFLGELVNQIPNMLTQ